MNSYLIIFENNNLVYSLEELHQVVVETPKMLEWWHYISNVYIVTTTSDSAKDISDHILLYLSNLRFIVIKVNINDINGSLPKDAWDWINEKLSTPKLIEKTFKNEDYLKNLLDKRSSTL